MGVQGEHESSALFDGSKGERSLPRSWGSRGSRNAPLTVDATDATLLRGDATGGRNASPCQDCAALPVVPRSGRRDREIRAVLQPRAAETKRRRPLGQLLEKTKGTWKQGDGVAWQEQSRSEWDDR